MSEEKPESLKAGTAPETEDIRVSDIFAGMPDDGYFRQFARCRVPQKRSAQPAEPPREKDKGTTAG